MTLENEKNQVRVQDVALRAGVSVGTVSRVLNDHPNVESTIRLRVLNAINDLGFVHHRRRRANQPSLESNLPEIKTGIKPQIKRITLCCRTGIRQQNILGKGSTYFSQVLQGAETECVRWNLHLSYRIIEDKANELPRAREALKTSKAEALLLVNFADYTLTNGLLELGLPAVLVDHYFQDLPLDAVTNDSYHGAIKAMQYLLKQGHRRIGFINGLFHYTIQRRYDAYRLILDDIGVGFKPEWVIPGDLTVEGGRSAANEFVRRGLNCTAIFCANDETAFGLMQGLAAHGLRVPEDISVIGFDDEEAARLVSPPLTTIRANAFSLGRLAVHRLRERIADPTLPPTHSFIQAELIERKSVRFLDRD
jgi:LacI family transcriptional regulator